VTDHDLPPDAPTREPGSHARSLSLILIATALAGVGGYAITTVVARGLGPVGYASFAVFWASLYLAVGTLAGMQQETSRAARAGTSRGGSELALLIGGVSVAVALLITVLVAVAHGVLFPEYGWLLGVPLIVGPVASVTVASITGLLYGAHAWRTLAVVIVADVALRLVGIVVVLALHGGVILVAWAAVAPFVVMAIGLVAGLRLAPHLRVSLDVGLRTLVSHVAQTIGGAVGISLLVSGFPLFVKVLSPDQDASTVGTLVYALILTRAPLVVSVLAVQSYLVVFLRDRVAHTARAVLSILGVLLAVGLVLAALASLFGPGIVAALAGDGYRVPALTLALLVLVSVLTGALAVTGAAVLAKGLHGWYVAGWTLAAGVSVLLLAIPGDLSIRMITALAGGPLIGVCLHLLALRRPVAGAASTELAPPVG